MKIVDGGNATNHDTGGCSNPSVTITVTDGKRRVTAQWPHREVKVTGPEVLK